MVVAMKEKTVRYFCDNCEEQLGDDEWPQLYAHMTCETVFHNAVEGDTDSVGFHLCDECTPNDVYAKGEDCIINYREDTDEITMIQVKDPSTVASVPAKDFTDDFDEIARLAREITIDG